MKKLLLITVALLCFEALSSQSNDGLRPWYSLYLHKKINHRWSVDQYTLLARRNMQQDYWLTQFNFGVNYRLDRFYTLSLGYGQSLYRYSGAWWDRHYPDLEPNFVNALSFHSISLAVRRRDRLSKALNLTHKLTANYYIPRFEKYQIRFHLSSKLSYRRRNLPLGLQPFVQGALYYYLNGVPATYFEQATDEDGNSFLEEAYEASPNGLHRLRLRVGVNFRPIKDQKWISTTLYYGYNREFNGIGNDLNFARPSQVSDRIFTTYPFNNYGILGVQINCFLR